MINLIKTILWIISYEKQFILILRLAPLSEGDDTSVLPA